MNVKERTYQRWEAGDATPDIPTLRRLADVLGVSVSTLIEETE
jgi:transcriptional regulator with XRE-family HTH domain